MRLEFRVDPKGPNPRVLCGVDVYFDADTPLHGMRLTGITIWEGDYGPYVTFPARENDPRGGPKAARFFEYLRAADVSGSPEAMAAILRTKAWILQEWNARGCPQKARR